jgi:LytS/YehU family sensor histidine kinase
LLLAIMIADGVADRLRRPWIAYVIAIGAAAIAGTLALALVDWLLGIPLALVRVFPGNHRPDAVLLYRVSHFALLTGLIAFVYLYQRTAFRNAAALHALRLRTAEIARHTLESRLQATQARVDPQFLFNSLADVEWLHECDPSKANRLLDDLIVYLRAVLPTAQQSVSTLGTEFSLVRAYLNILRAGRASFSFDMSLPDALAANPIPPMILLPLVETIVVPVTGTRRLDVEIGAGDEAELAITLLTQNAEPDVASVDAALDRIRKRLTTLCGAGASLAVRQLSLGGLEAKLRIPYAHAIGADR